MRIVREFDKFCGNFVFQIVLIIKKTHIKNKYVFLQILNMKLL